jgi:hypothetical protein
MSAHTSPQAAYVLPSGYVALHSQPCHVNACHSCVLYSAWNSKDTYDLHASFLVQFNGLMSLTSYFDVIYIITLPKPHIPARLNMYFVINKCVTPVKVSNFSGHYIRNRSTLDISVLSHIAIL